MQERIENEPSIAAGDGVPHRLLAEPGVLIIEPTRRLRPEDFDAIANTIDPWIEEHGGLRGIVVRTPKFPGWASVRGLAKHLQFIRDHHHDVKRVAVAVDGLVAEWTPRLAGPFLAPELRQFASDELDAAVAWASESDDEPTKH